MKPISSFKISVVTLLLATLLLVFVLSIASARVSKAESDVEQFTTESGVVVPDNPADLLKLDTTTPAEKEAIQLRLLEMRENIVAQVDNNPTDVYDLTPVVESSVAETTQSTFLSDGSGESPDAPGDLVVGINRRNSRSTSVSSTLAETAATNDGRNVFYMGNTYASYSTNDGSTWSAKTIPAGPSANPTACCDPDVVFHQGRAITFWIILYVNSALTDGSVRIFVQNWIPNSPACSYTIDYGTNILPDYPHLGVSNNYLYLATQNMSPTSWTGSQMRRYNLEQMSNCQTTSFNTFTYSGGVGQRVFVPAQGATETMYWGQNETTTSFRIYSWPESTTVVSSVVKSVSTSTFANPDCRGGTGHNDWIERTTAWSIAGFRLRMARAENPADGTGEIWAWWNAANDSTHPQAYTRTARFRETDKILLGQPNIWNSTNCTGFPSAAVNARGHIGLTLGWGGDKTANSGTAARAYVGIIDDYNWPAVGTVFLTADGTHNRSDGRYGDYHTARTNTPCNLAWTASNYALLNGNTSSSHVNARWVQFYRARDSRCFVEWRDQQGTP